MIAAPTRAAISRAVWLATVDRGLRCGPRGSDVVRGAYRDLRAHTGWVAPSLYAQAAIERALWLAAVDRCLTSTGADSTEVRRSYAALRRLIDWVAPSLYAQTPIDEAREIVWVGRMREAIDAGTAAERAATVVWASVGAWTDAPSGRWGALADAGAALGDALDAGGTVVPRRATALRETMTVVWREMEERR